MVAVVEGYPSQDESIALVQRAYEYFKERYRFRAVLTNVEWWDDIHTRQTLLYMYFAFPGLTQGYSCEQRVDESVRYAAGSLRQSLEDVVLQMMQELLRDPVFNEAERLSRIATPGSSIAHWRAEMTDVTTLADSVRRYAVTHVMEPAAVASLPEFLRETAESKSPTPPPPAKPIGGVRGIRASLRVTEEVKAIQFNRARKT